MRPWTATLLALALALLIVMAGPSGDLGAARFITVDGIAVAVSEGTTLEQVTEARAVSPAPGARLDVAGDVILPGSGGSGMVEVRGRVASPDMELNDGTSVTTRRGPDRPEALVRTTQVLPHGVASEGSGSVVALVRRGADGEKELFVGESSRRTAAVFVLSEPVDGLLRHSSGLSSGQKAVALTFDDGPSRYTDEIVAVLADKGIPATFFWVGSVAAGKDETIRQVRAAGHEVENHSWSHADLTTLDGAAIASEIARTAEALGGTRFLRPPYGSYNSDVAEQAGLQGQRLALWDVDSLDWKIRDAASITARVKAGVKPGAVIIMHDGGGDRSQTVAALPAVVQWLLEEGYALTTLRQLVGE
ncbi:MAG: polysaccharide deacetylase family protein [Thermoleophilia bacterium]